MSHTANSIELPEDLQDFADERVRTHENASVAEVVREAMEAKKLAALREAVNAGVAELNAGNGTECSPDELMAGVYAKLGLT